MASKSSFSLDPVYLLQICLGAFLLTVGILGATSYNSQLSGLVRFFGKNDSLNLVVAIAEIAMAVLLFVGLALRLPGALGQIIGLVLPLLWAAWIVMTYFVNSPFKPDVLPWFMALSRDLVILISLWIVGRRFAGN